MSVQKKFGEDKPVVNATGSIIQKDMKEGIPCPYCPCRFFTDHDYHCHLEAFGYDPVKHRKKFDQLVSEIFVSED